MICMSDIRFQLMFKAVMTSREKSVCPPDKNEPMVVFTSVFYKSDMISYGLVGGKNNRFVSK